MTAKLLLVMSLLMPSAGASTWNDVGYGRWTVVQLQHTPFPHGKQQSAPFDNRDVYIFIPKGYRPHAQTDLIIEHHGHRAIINPQNTIKPSYVEKHRQDYQLFESRKNAILVIPQAAYNASNSDAGSFADFNGFRSFIDDVLNFLKKETVIPGRSALGGIYLMSFSGGYRITANDFTQNDSTFLRHIRSVSLWDSFYGEEQRYYDWVFHRRSLFFDFFTPTGGTDLLSRQIRDSLAAASVPFDTTFFASGKKTKIHIQFTHRGHLHVADGEFTYAEVLKVFPLADLDIIAPQLLSAIPQSGAIHIQWAPVTNSRLRGFRLFSSSNGYDWHLLAGETALLPSATRFVHHASGKWLYRLATVNHNGEEKFARITLGAFAAATLPKILLVHGENRRLANSLRGFDPKKFLYHRNKSLLIPAIRVLQKSFASCSNRAISGGSIQPGQFKYVLWLSGNENISDKVIDHAEQAWLKQHFATGGNLLLLGSGLADDLCSEFTSPNDRTFAGRWLGLSGADSLKSSIHNINGTGLFKNLTLPLNHLPENIFRHAIHSLFADSTGQIFGGKIKRRLSDDKTYCAWVVNISLHSIAVPAARRQLFESFFADADTGALTPDPPQLPESIYMPGDRLHIDYHTQNQRVVIGQFDGNLYPLPRDILANDSLFILPASTPSDCCACAPVPVVCSVKYRKFSAAVHFRNAVPVGFPLETILPMQQRLNIFQRIFKALRK